MAVLNEKRLHIGEYTDEMHAESPEDLRIGEHGYKYRLVEGRVMPPYITPARYALSRSVRTRASDICFVSYPKSGSTWLSYIIVLLTTTGADDPDPDRSGATTLRGSLHWVESSWTYPRSAEDLERAAAPRIFKSHMPYPMALGGEPAQNPCRYIYIARNPKDVCASYYYFESGKSWSGYYDGGWDHWLDMFLGGRVQRGDWFDHTLSWWEHRDAENVLFLRFEDLKLDTRGQLERIARFLGVRVSDDQLREVERKIGFAAMQQTEFSALREVKEFSRFFRKGEIGSWKEYFTAEQSEAFDRLYKERIGESGLEFMFE
ncbi:P-loop containing nucleoside triphosphate hydrolase protein [Parachaetomium inaequale]|uniref:P-loop containing nucleoside triphosphate hydrolase protein n=1 Tax=Parachaetomium inaequale TaxID=2588326 RepID=A0AAN6SKG6_9PEZI|nr:P-loop containing nucleoside triphosphate hydrolase protein [Parachaetomium inaequale]